MRIHRLEISAFGPFAGTETIDFDRLSAHGLFLLNGATGAGKTSVLDAICFALYGSVPGARQDGKRLRSDHADVAAEPRVTCEFSAKDRHFEVSRSPAWNKPSARGKNGFTEQKANTLLRERVDGQWVEKSGRNDEAGAEITAVLGMDRDQFTRVVMLPQGDFAAFLRSKPTDRLELLQSLFGTQRFEAVEQELARRAADARAGVAALNGQLELLLAQAQAEAATPEPEQSDAGHPPDGAEEFLGWLGEAAAATAGRLRTAADHAEAQRTEASGALDAARARAARQQKLAAAEGRRSAADSAGPELESMASRLRAHRKAEVLGGQLQGVKTAEEAEELAGRAMVAAVDELRNAAVHDPELKAFPACGRSSGSGSPLGADGHSVDVADVRQALGRLRSLRAVLEERLPDEARLAAMAVRRSELHKTLDSLAERHRAGASALEALRGEATGLLAGLRPLEELAAETQLRTKEAASATELVLVVGRYAAAMRECSDVAGQHRLARDDHQNHRQRWLDLREERLANAAAELAARLQPAEPCPVCGSPEHPSPAPAASAALVIADAEQAAQQASEAAEAVVTALARELAEAQQAAAVLAAQGGDTPPDEARRDATLAGQRADDALQAADHLAASRARYAELEEQIAAAEAAQAETASAIVHTESTIAEVREQSDSLEGALGKLRADHAALGDRITAVEGSAALLERADSAHTRLEQAVQRTADARRQLELALPDSGFESAAAAQSVLLPAPEPARLEAAVRAGQDEAARVEELFAGEELVLAARELELDGPMNAVQVLEALGGEAAAAERRAKDAVVALGLAEKSVRTVRRIAADYARLAQDGKGPRERAALLTAVAEAARGAGDNSYRMSLNSYVLAARLEQVAMAASERLVGMSDGRYTLQHSDARAARGAKSGLGLEVVDQWTGHKRDTATLSGGESFMASLALALGLADVVQQESGGVDIETLFVDEGFGSLDEQALEQVMDALEGLRDGGRVVGLVSHVPEMKQRISTQLQVVKGRNGSLLHISDDALG